MVLLFFGVLASFFCIYIINNNNTGKMGQYFINITLANQIPVIKNQLLSNKLFYITNNINIKKKFIIPNNITGI